MSTARYTARLAIALSATSVCLALAACERRIDSQVVPMEDVHQPWLAFEMCGLRFAMPREMVLRLHVDGAGRSGYKVRVDESLSLHLVRSGQPRGQDWLPVKIRCAQTPRPQPFMRPQLAPATMTSVGDGLVAVQEVHRDGKYIIHAREDAGPHDYYLSCYDFTSFVTERRCRVRAVLHGKLEVEMYVDEGVEQWRANRKAFESFIVLRDERDTR